MRERPPRKHIPPFSLPSPSLSAADIMSDTVEARFKKAVWLIRNGPKEGGSSNDTKLQFYSFFKQVSGGAAPAANWRAINVAEGDRRAGLQAPAQGMPTTRSGGQ